MHAVKYYYSKPQFVGRIFTNSYGDSYISSMKPMRRYTMAAIYDEDHHEIRIGVSICQPMDNFSKKIGRELAYENALNKPFHIISNFSGRRNDYVDQIYEIMQSKELSLNRSIHH